MKIFKIAAGGINIPDGMVMIEVRIKPDGSLKREIIRGGKSQCEEGAGKKMDDFLNTPVEGFTGKLADVEDQNYTDEHFEQMQSQKPRSKPAKHRNAPEEDFEPPMPGIQEGDKEGHGFGV